jgi:hypothetical protein
MALALGTIILVPRTAPREPPLIKACQPRATGWVTFGRYAIQDLDMGNLLYVWRYLPYFEWIK